MSFRVGALSRRDQFEVLRVMRQLAFVLTAGILGYIYVAAWII